MFFHYDAVWYAILDVLKYKKSGDIYIYIYIYIYMYMCVCVCVCVCVILCLCQYVHVWVCVGGGCLCAYRQIDWLKEKIT